MEKRKIRAKNALNDIHSRYPFINLQDIELFSPVYYPIARIEADMNEKTFEDFDSVQEAVLRFVSLGFKDKNTIAELMGLNAEYVEKMLKLLFSYGHIDRQYNMTELGKSSLAEGQKITIAFTKQLFLLDALNCHIIRVDKDVDRTIVERTDEMDKNDKYITFLDHAAGISKADVETTLKNAQYNTLKRIQGGMNINVIEVSDVRCLGIRYVKSYMLKLKGHSPIIFVKRFDFSGKGKERFFYLPFSVEHTSEREFLKLPDLWVHSIAVEEMIEDAYNRILENRQSPHMQEQLPNKLDYFTKEQCRLKLDKYDNNITLTCENFTEYNKNILSVLDSFGRNGLYALVDDGLAGYVLLLYPDKRDKLLLSCSEYAAKALAKYSRDKVFSYIEQHLEKDKNPIESINDILHTLMN